MLRVGIYGGAFAPIHNGHVAASKAFMRQMWLDVLFVIPTGVSPHKEMDRSASNSDRLQMCRLAFEGVDGVIISDMEMRREGKSYSVDTLRALSGEDRRLFMLCGTDMMLTLGEWNQPEEIFKLCYPVYIRREKDTSLDSVIINKIAEYKEKYGRNVIRIDAPVIEVSSREIREKLRRGEDVSDCLDPRVLEYIKQKELYK